MGDVLRLIALYKPSQTGWVTEVIGSKGETLYVGPARPYRQMSLDDGREWCKSNRPGIKIVIY